MLTSNIHAAYNIQIQQGIIYIHCDVQVLVCIVLDK